MEDYENDMGAERKRIQEMLEGIHQAETEKEYPEKATVLLQVTDKSLSYNIVSSPPRLSWIRTHNVSGDKH
jgi:hypothetical protein